MQTDMLKNNRGFTLVEVLVAVVILSIGLLAVAGMQTSSLRGGNSALLRSQAILGAEDILDRMRANRAAMAQYAIEIDEPDPDEWTTLAELVDELDDMGYADMVLTDLAEWKFFLSGNLPSGVGSVDVDGNVVTVIIRWTDSFGMQEVEMVTRL